ncbi:MAG: mechanosensitive ion channel family protein [Putridiphycobacter sp.]|nr:mechanosensitive ion channel family protein [Putridiphycobacter sp.]
MTDGVKSSWDEMINRVTGWLDTLIVNLPNVFIAAIIFIVAYWLSKNMQVWTNKLLKKRITQASVRNLLANVISIAVVALGLVLALGVLNLDTVLKSILAGAGVLGLAVGLALQGTLSNSFSGVFLAVKDIINVGDWVETNGYSGQVVEINLRSTKIKEADNNIIVIPNKMVVHNPFKNFGLTQRIRTIVKCGVSYDSDLEEVKALAIKSIKDNYPTEEGENIEFHYLEFGDSSINFQIRFWVDATAKLTALEAKSEAIMVIKKSFDKAGIDIPYPIRTLIHKNSPLQSK